MIRQNYETDMYKPSSFVKDFFFLTKLTLKIMTRLTVTQAKLQVVSSPKILKRCWLQNSKTLTDVGSRENVLPIQIRVHFRTFIHYKLKITLFPLLCVSEDSFAGLDFLVPNPSQYLVSSSVYIN